MHTYDLVINDRRTRETFKGVAKLSPQSNTIATTAFIVKPVYTINSGTFVVSPQNKKVFGILDFIGKEEAYDLN